jgi:8-oxo-dGTP pyrophosphatase MutT (NUDIX family)
MTKPNKPTLAAAVILLRHAEQNEFEVFLTRRPDGMPFLGGKYGYPGGAVRAEDFAAPMIDRCSGLTPTQARGILGAHLSPREALGVWVAAVRELFEEVGILLAVEESGAPFRLDGERAGRLANQHQALLHQALSFRELLEAEKLLCDLSGLSHFSAWQTPAHVSMRFDTRFFVAALPPGQAPLATTREVAHGVWLTPDHAMQLFDRGELPLIFPTFAALRTLADFDTLESVLREYRNHLHNSR